MQPIFGPFPTECTLPPGVEPDALSTTLPAALIEREAAEALFEFLHAPVGPVLDVT
jgi:hypothetical protein